MSPVPGLRTAIEDAFEKLSAPERDHREDIPLLIGKSDWRIGADSQQQNLLSYIDDETYRRRILTQLNRLATLLICVNKVEKQKRTGYQNRYRNRYGALYPTLNPFPF